MKVLLIILIVFKGKFLLLPSPLSVPLDVDEFVASGKRRRRLVRTVPRWRLPHRANELVFVRDNTSQRVASKLSDEVDAISNIDSRCIKDLCYVLFPACSTSDDATESVPTISVAVCQRMQVRCGDLYFHEAVVKKFLHSTTTSSIRYEVPVSCCLTSTCRHSATRFRDRSSRSADTCKGNCSFPFTYYGVVYEDCTDIAVQYRDNRLWCFAKSGTHRCWRHCPGSTDGYPVLRSTKEVYDGGDLCKRFIGNSSVFVDSRYNQTFMSKVMIALEELLESPPNFDHSSVCYDDLMRFLCFSIFPSPVQHEPNGSIFPAPMCRRNCNYFLMPSRSPCFEALVHVVRGIVDYFEKEELNPIQIYFQMSSETCKSLTDDPGSCTDFSLVLPTAPSSKFLLPAIITGLLVPASVVLIVTILCVVRYRRVKAQVHSTLQRLSEKEPQLLSLKLSTGIETQLSLKDMLEQLKSISLLEPDIPNYSLDSIKYIKDLGEGTFGQVFLGAVVRRDSETEEDETLVAVKVLKNSSDDHVKKDFDAEMQIMKLLNHPNIVALLAKSESESAMGLVFEYMLYGDLNCFLRASEPGEETLIRSEDKAEGTKHVLTLDNLTYMIMQICCALSYLAEYRFVHRDIATRNCLVGKGLTTKLADFGLAKEIDSDYYRISKNRALLPIRWLSPESILYGKSSLKSDIWAFGILMWEVLTFGRRPYVGLSNAEVVEFIIGGGRPELPDTVTESCPSFLKDVMKRCWLSDPAMRPTAAEILTMH